MWKHRSFKEVQMPEVLRQVLLPIVLSRAQGAVQRASATPLALPSINVASAGWFEAGEELRHRATGCN